MSEKTKKTKEDEIEEVEEDESFDDFEDEDVFEMDPEEWDKLREEDPSRVLRALGFVPDVVKRAVMSGVGNIFLTEESIRSMVADKNIPREAVGFLIHQADSTRRELLRIVSREVRVFLENMDFGGEIAKILTSLSFEIRTEVRFIANEDAVRPDVKNRVKVKRTTSDGRTEEEELFNEGIEDPEEEEPAGRQESPEEDDTRGRRRWTRRRGSEG